MSMITFRLAREQQEKKRQPEKQAKAVADAAPVVAEEVTEKVKAEVADHGAVEAKPTEVKSVAPPMATVKAKPSITSRK